MSESRPCLPNRADVIAREAVIGFLATIGIRVSIGSTKGGFLRRIRIADGKLRISHNCPASNILHEAGHLALIPEQWRAQANGDVSAVIQTAFEAADKNINPDSQLWRALIQCSDSEATAWAWAVGVHIGLPENQIIRNSEYQRTGAELRQNLRTRTFIGISGLHHAGLCEKKSYPAMKRWLQPICAP